MVVTILLGITKRTISQPSAPVLFSPTRNRNIALSFKRIAHVDVLREINHGRFCYLSLSYFYLLSTFAFRILDCVGNIPANIYRALDNKQSIASFVSLS